MEFVAVFVFGTLLSALCLWVGMKLTVVDGTFLAMIIVAAISSLLGFIPVVGGIVSTVALFFLICKWTDADFFPDAVLIVVVAKAAGFFGGLFLAGLVA